MKLALVGVGDAGSRIANRILDVESSTGRHFCQQNAITIITATPDAVAADQLPDNRQLLIGDTHAAVNGEGVDGDPQLAVEVARGDLDEIRRAFDPIEFCEVDAILVVAGLGGGTGSGVGAVVIEELQAICEAPVYGIGILPGEDEGASPAMNAARALKSFVPTADNVILFDNEVWGSNEKPSETGYDEMNQRLATRLVNVFAGGEFTTSSVAENKLDPSDVMRTLDTGGVSSIGDASKNLPRRGGGLLSWLPWWGTDDGEPTDAATIKNLVRRAAMSKLTLPCDIESADRVLLVLSGPPETISRKGFEEARYWLEDVTDTVDVLAGDEPQQGSSTLTATVVFSNVTDVSRIDAIQQQAVDARSLVGE